MSRKVWKFELIFDTRDRNDEWTAALGMLPASDATAQVMDSIKHMMEDYFQIDATDRIFLKEMKETDFHGAESRAQALANFPDYINKELFHEKNKSSDSGQ